MERDRLAPVRERAGLLVHHLRYDCLCVGSGERRLAGQHFVEDRAQRVDIGPGIDRLARGLLGAHVLGSAEAHPGLRDPHTAAVASSRERDPEVGHHRAAVVEQDVVGLDVAMNHPVAMGVVEPGGDFARDPNRVVNRKLNLASEPGPERLTGQVGHDEKDRPVDPAGVEQGEDVGMLQVGGGLDLLQKPLGPDQRGDIGPEHLDRDFAIVAKVVGQVDGGHASGTQLALQGVAVGQGDPETFQWRGHCLKDRGSARALPWRERQLRSPPIGAAFSYNRVPVRLLKFSILRPTAFDLDLGAPPLAIHSDLLTQAAPPTVAVELDVNGPSTASISIPEPRSSTPCVSGSA